jgi:hypothetical protein
MARAADVEAAVGEDCMGAWGELQVMRTADIEGSRWRGQQIMRFVDRRTAAGEDNSLVSVADEEGSRR